MHACHALHALHTLHSSHTVSEEQPTMCIIICAVNDKIIVVHTVENGVIENWKRVLTLYVGYFTTIHKVVSRCGALKWKVFITQTVSALSPLWAVIAKTCNITSDDEVVTVSTVHLQCLSSGNIWCRKMWHSEEIRILGQCIALHLEC